MKEYGDTFLLGPFREFYREVIRLKGQVKAGPIVATPTAAPSAPALGPAAYEPEAVVRAYFPDEPAGPESRRTQAAEAGDAWFAPRGDVVPPWAAPREGADGNGAAGYAPAPTPLHQVHAGTYAWQSLLTLFERQKAHAWRYGGTYGAEFYKEAQYVMVALADEIFLNEDWEGREVWVSNLLESRIFGTHVAGELFFRRLERLLADRNPVYRDLGAVYLMALSLGFRGKYRGVDDRGLLEGYRRQLFAFVFQREPDLDAPGRHVFPETYFHTLRDEARRRLPNPRAWIILLCATVLAYVALTHGIWVQLTQPLFDANDEITRPAERDMGLR